MDDDRWDPYTIHSDETGVACPRLLDRRPVLASADFSPDGATLLTAGWNGVLAAWDAETARLRETLLEPSDPDRLSPWTEGTTATPDAAGRIRVARLREWLRGWSLSAVRFSPDGRWFAVGGRNGFVVVWDALERREIHAHQADWTGIAALALSPNRRLAATGCRILRGVNVKVWNVPSRPGERFRKIFASAEPAAGVRNLGFSPNGRFLLVVGEPGPPLLFRVRTGRVKAPWDWVAVETAEFSPRGSLIAAGDSIGRIKIRAWKRNRDVGEIKAHAGAIRALAWSPDGRRLASGGEDGAVRLWDVASGALHREWPLPSRVLAFRFCEGGRALRAASAVDDPNRPEIRRLI